MRVRSTSFYHSSNRNRSTLSKVIKPRSKRHEGVILLPDIYNSKKASKTEKITAEGSFRKKKARKLEAWIAMTDIDKRELTESSHGLIRTKHHIVQDSFLELHVNGKLQYSDDSGWLRR